MQVAETAASGPTHTGVDGKEHPATTQVNVVPCSEYRKGWEL